MDISDGDQKSLRILKYFKYSLKYLEVFLSNTASGIFKCYPNICINSTCN